MLSDAARNNRKDFMIDNIKWFLFPMEELEKQKNEFITKYGKSPKIVLLNTEKAKKWYLKNYESNSIQAVWEYSNTLNGKDYNIGKLKILELTVVCVDSPKIEFMEVF